MKKSISILIALLALAALLAFGLPFPDRALVDRFGGNNYYGYAVLGFIAVFFLMVFLYSKGKNTGQAEAWNSAKIEIKNEIESAKRFMATELDVQREAMAAVLESGRQALAQKEEQFEERKSIFEKIASEKEIGFPWLAGKIAEFYSAKDEAVALRLEARKNPAYKAAYEVRQIKAEKRSLLTELRMHQYQLEYYESLFPWLLEYRDIPDEEIIRREAGSGAEAESEEDPAFQLLAPAELTSLSMTELFQQALNRYVAGRKTNWEIGRDYERYIGSQLEMDGYDVEYFGARQGKENMGPDLIAKKDGQVEVIQCKYWTQGKIIHENHIFQLFGSAFMYAYDESGAINTSWALTALRNGNVTPVLVCSCTVSALARSMADGLGMTIRDNKPFDPGYSRIKCSISRNDKEKVYLLPFDQMYDRIRIRPDEGELYARTVVEAEAKGFRRAFPWRG